MDFSGKPFGPMPQILATADFITKLHAICVRCGNIANFSYRKTDQTQKVMLGETESYEPRCRSCFYEGQQT
jgi:thymidine kinase